MSEERDYSRENGADEFKDSLDEFKEQTMSELDERLDDNASSQDVNVDANKINVNAESVETNDVSTTQADHVDHGSKQSSKTHKVDMDLFSSSANTLMFVAIFMHLIDKFFFSTSFANTPLRLTLYGLFAFASYFILETGENGLSVRQAIIEYSIVTGIAVFLFPLLNALITGMPQVGVIDFVREYLAFFKLAIMPWPLYYLGVRGMTQRIHASNTGERLKAYLTTPVKWPKLFYSVLVVLLFLYAVTTMPLQEQAQRLDQQLPETSALRAGTGVSVLTDIAVTGVMGFANQTVTFIQGGANSAREFIEDPLGTGYQTEVEDNRLGIEVDVSRAYQDSQRPARAIRQEGSSYIMQGSIQYSSENALAADITVRCELLNREEEVVRSFTKDGRTLGGTNTNSYIETCEFDDLGTTDDRTTRYTARMAVTFPFRTQATTEYYFVDSSLRSEQPARYQAQVSDLDADEADAMTTAGPIQLATANSNVNMPVQVNEENNKLFPYGFTLKTQQGEITNITWIEMDIPEYFDVQEGPTCQVGGDTADALREPKPGYKKVIFDEYVSINQNNNPYAACNFEYNAEAYDDLIFSQDTIQPVTFSVTAEYNYQNNLDTALTVEPRVLAQQNESEGGQNDTQTT